MGKFNWKDQDGKFVVYRNCEHCGKRFLLQMPHARFHAPKWRIAAFRQRPSLALPCRLPDFSERRED